MTVDVEVNETGAVSRVKQLGRLSQFDQGVGLRRRAARDPPAARPSTTEGLRHNLSGHDVSALFARPLLRPASAAATSVSRHRSARPIRIGGIGHVPLVSLFRMVFGGIFSRSARS